MIGNLLKVIAYVGAGVMALLIFGATSIAFDMVPWYRTRIILVVLIVLMFIVFNRMHEFRYSRFVFLFWATLAVLLGIVEIGAMLSLLIYTLQHNGGPEILSILDRILNAILLVVSILFNMIGGVWIFDRIEEVEKKSK